MSDGFRVDPATFTAGASSVSGAGGAVAAAAQALSAALAGTGGMAGADEVGQKFSAQYDPAAAALATLLGNLAGGLGTVADALEATGANYATADGASVMRTGR
jgi:uncharacterized protein YukE